MGFAVDRPLLVQRDRCEVPSVADDHGHVLRRGGVPRAARHRNHAADSRRCDDRSGLCMSGMYGTTVANAGDLFSRYPASMGIYVTLNGFGAALAPAAIGIAANRAGIRWGFATLLIAGVLLVVSAVLNARYFKGRQHSQAVSRA